MTMPAVPIWHLAFCEAESMWWHRWLRPGYRHCWAFGFSPGAEGADGRWLVVDPCFESLSVRLGSEAEIEGWLVAAQAGALRVLKIEAAGQPVYRPRWVVTCAGALAALVGLAATPLTPWGLACIARRFGAVEVGDGQGVGAVAEAAVERAGAGAV